MIKNNLKKLIKNNLNDNNLNKIKNVKILAITCYWSIKNFSAILKYKGIKFYCYYDNTINDILVENY